MSFDNNNNKIHYTTERKVFFSRDTRHLIIWPLDICENGNFYLQYQPKNCYIESDYGIAINDINLKHDDMIKILQSIYNQNNYINKTYWNENFTAQTLNLFYLVYYIDTFKVAILTIKKITVNGIEHVVYNFLDLGTSKIYNINEKIYLTKLLVNNHLLECDTFINKKFYKPIDYIAKRKCVINREKKNMPKFWKTIANVGKMHYSGEKEIYVRKFKSPVEINSWIGLYAINKHVNDFNNHFLIKCTKIWLLMPYDYLQTTEKNKDFSENYLLESMRNKNYEAFTFIIFGKPYQNFLEMDFWQIHDTFNKNMLLKDDKFQMYNNILLCAVWTSHTENYIYGDFSVCKYKNLIYTAKNIKYTNVARNITIKDTLEFKLPINFIKYV